MIGGIYKSVRDFCPGKDARLVPCAKVVVGPILTNNKSVSSLFISMVFLFVKLYIFVFAKLTRKGVQSPKIHIKVVKYHAFIPLETKMSFLGGAQSA